MLGAVCGNGLRDCADWQKETDLRCLSWRSYGNDSSVFGLAVENIAIIISNLLFRLKKAHPGNSFGKRSRK